MYVWIPTSAVKATRGWQRIGKLSSKQFPVGWEAHCHLFKMQACRTFQKSVPVGEYCQPRLYIEYCNHLNAQSFALSSSVCSATKCKTWRGLKASLGICCVTFHQAKEAWEEGPYAVAPPGELFTWNVETRTGAGSLQEKRWTKGVRGISHCEGNCRKMVRNYDLGAIVSQDTSMSSPFQISSLHH